MRPRVMKLIVAVFWMLGSAVPAMGGPKDMPAGGGEKPKLMVLIQETHQGLDVKGLKLAETEMIRLLAGEGFPVVDKDQLDVAKKTNAIKMALAGDFKEAKALGLQYGAQYVLVGESVTTGSGPLAQGSNMKSIQAVLQVKLLHSNSGDVVGAVITQGTSPNINELAGAASALKQAAAEAVRTFVVPEMAAYQSKLREQGITVGISMLGVDAFYLYQAILEVFENQEGLTVLRKQGWDRSSGLLEFEVAYQGTPDALADAIEQMQVDDGGFYVEDITAHKLKVRYRE